MKKEIVSFGYEVYDSVEELNDADASLAKAAREVTADAYAPYSQFNVGAVAQLKNGQTVSGTNQENASYPVGICAERVLLSAASVLHKNVPIDTIAVSYHNLNGESGNPVSPCGMCRQALKEYEDRTNTPIRLILTGMSGKVFSDRKIQPAITFFFRQRRPSLVNFLSRRLTSCSLSFSCRQVSHSPSIR